MDDGKIPSYTDIEIINGLTLSRTFGEIAISVLTIIANTRFREIYLVFDQYIQPSVKYYHASENVSSDASLEETFRIHERVV